MPSRLNLQNSPARRLFNPEQWSKIQQSNAGRIDDATWASFSTEQKSAVQELRKAYQSDGFGRVDDRNDGGRLQGGDGGQHYAGRGMAIHEVQGTGLRSPVEGQTVKTSGIVTATDDKGFYLQEPNAGIENGSPGIYVFTGGRGTPVRPGDAIEVTGEVDEFTPPHQEDTSTTQLRAQRDSISVKSSGNPIPEVVIGRGGIELSKTESNAVTWEKLEGTRVRINDAVVTGAPNMIPRFSDMAVVPDGGEGAGKRTQAGGLIRDEIGNPNVVPVRMPVENLSRVDVGARFQKGLVGNVVERHGRHQVTVWDAGEGNLVPSNIKPEISQLRQKYPNKEHVLFIGSLNGENKDVKVEDQSKVLEGKMNLVDDDVGDGKLQRLAEQIVKNMTSPDIVAMQEIQDNDGSEISDVTDASVTWQAIIDKIVELGGPRYAFVDRPPVNGVEGGMPGGNIRNGFLYDPTRVTLKQETVYRMEDPAFEGARLPLVATFEFKHGQSTEKVTLTSVHNKSKRGGDETADTRDAQEVAINAWAKKNAPTNEFEHLGAYGDRNAYTEENAMKIEQRDGALNLLSNQLPENERYSTQFGGSSGELDHASVKTSVPVDIDLVHMNSDFDNRFRASDHDGTVTAWDFRRGQNN